MDDLNFISLYAQAAKTALGFFWKAGWAFVLGYSISAMIQTFVPKGKLTPYLGDKSWKSVTLSAIFGSASSSCSFAALATARSLIAKGASFIAGVAFMFASTNLVIELGILILIFLGWQFLAAEIIGGVVLIFISTILIKLTYPKRLIKAAREKIEKDDSEAEGDFDGIKRLKSFHGWTIVGRQFVKEWLMVWEEILIGFTIAGFVAVMVPAWFWQALFLNHLVGVIPGWLIAIENALIAPFVAAATFIGSMGNIPLATVLNANGVLFAGIMGFIYSDLMVPPLVMVNSKYYGKKIALYIAVIMFISIVLTALILNFVFYVFNLLPESSHNIKDIAQFAFDYTFYLNLFALIVTAILIWLSSKAEVQKRKKEKLTLKRVFALISFVILITGLLIFVFLPASFN